MGNATVTAQTGLEQLEGKTLRTIGLYEFRFWERFRTETVVTLLFGTSAVIVIVVNFVFGGPRHIVQTLAPLAAFTAFLFGYLQWRAARHEVSFEKYYDKLDTVNASFDAWRIEVLKNNSQALQSHLHTMFLFAELDNLEYVLEKYKLGYVGRELAERAIRGFNSRCGDTEFRRGVQYWVGREGGPQETGGYQSTTRKAVWFIVQECERSSR